MSGRKFEARRLERLADELEKRNGLMLSVFFALYALVTYYSSRRKFMWNDELYTYYIARLPAMSDVWNALMTGGEQLPPFFYVVTRSAIGFFGDSGHAFRLPEMLGFAVMLLCLFIFAARRASNCAGLLAATFPLVTFAYFYAYEARPYGLVLGFAALSLFCWQSATMNVRRPFSLIALTLSLSGALCSHYYGVFVVFPIALGEAVRTLFNKKIDKPVWLACAAAVAPLFLHLPLIARARGYAGAFWAPPVWMNIANFYFNLLYMSVLPLLFLILLAWGYKAARARGAFARHDRAPAEINVPAHELAAAIGFMLIPVICVVLAKTVTGAFTDRYAVSAIIGVSLLFAFAGAKLLGNRALPLAALAIFMAAWFGLLVFNETWKASTSTATPESKIALLRNLEDDLPIIAADPYTFIELEHYAPPELRARVAYLADPEIALRRLKHNSIERGQGDLIKPWFKMNVMDYRSYIAGRPRFFLCGDPGFFSWIVPQLKEDGMKLELREMEGKTLVFLVEPAEVGRFSRRELK
ncbi:MAG TPA: glycosyltransferase family 39 protein [Pyrinomonadaceae bacterium]|jgi:hypothetical protein